MKKLYGAYVLVFLAILGWSAVIAHNDYVTWFMEVVPAIVALVVLCASYKRFPLTPLAYTLVLVHAIVLCVGAKYTYAEVPLFHWLGEALEHSRNNYDKVGHFMQGFSPAIVARELLVRHRVVNGKRWLAFLVVCVCLSISALYELIEWWVAVGSGDSAEAFLGTQGYEWDTQSDMLMALIGAVCAVLLLGRMHDSMIARLEEEQGEGGE